MNPRQLAGLGLVCVVLFVTSQLPARVAFGLLAPAGITGLGLRDTVWQGSAAVINLPGLQLRNTEWDLAGWRLLTGELGGDFKSRWDGGSAQGYAARSLFSDLLLENTQANLSGAWVSRIASLPGVDGDVNVTIERLKVDELWPEQLIGTVSVRNLSSSLVGAGSAGLLGNMVAEFDTTTESAEDTVSGTIRDDGGPLEIEGTLILQKPTNYSLSVKVKPRADASGVLRQSMQFLGSPDASGAYLFELSGSF